MVCSVAVDRLDKYDVHAPGEPRGRDRRPVRRAHAATLRLPRRVGGSLRNTSLCPLLRLERRPAAQCRKSGGRGGCFLSVLAEVVWVVISSIFFCNYEEYI